MLTSMIVLALSSAAVSTTAAPAPRKGLDPNRMICRTDEVTGSHLNSTRKCMTAMQWKEYDRNQRESVDQIQRAGMPRVQGG